MDDTSKKRDSSNILLFNCSLACHVKNLKLVVRHILLYLLLYILSTYNKIVEHKSDTSKSLKFYHFSIKTTTTTIIMIIIIRSMIIIVMLLMLMIIIIILIIIIMLEKLLLMMM